MWTQVKETSSYCHQLKVSVKEEPYFIQRRLGAIIISDIHGYIA